MKKRMRKAEMKKKGRQRMMERMRKEGRQS